MGNKILHCAWYNFNDFNHSGTKTTFLCWGSLSIVENTSVQLYTSHWAVVSLISRPLKCLFTFIQQMFCHTDVQTLTQTCLKCISSLLPYRVPSSCDRCREGDERREQAGLDRRKESHSQTDLLVTESLNKPPHLTLQSLLGTTTMAHPP